jgi:hypothetical protein
MIVVKEQPRKAILLPECSRLQRAYGSVPVGQRLSLVPSLPRSTVPILGIYGDLPGMRFQVRLGALPLTPQIALRFRAASTRQKKSWTPTRVAIQAPSDGDKVLNMSIGRIG